MSSTPRLTGVSARCIQCQRIIWRYWDSTRDMCLSCLDSERASEPQRLAIIRLPPSLILCDLCSGRFPRSTFIGFDGTLHARCASCRKRERCTRCRKIKKRRHFRKDTELPVTYFKTCDKCRQRKAERATVRRPSDTYAPSSPLITFALAFIPDVALLANLHWCTIGQYQMMAQLCTSNELDVVSGDRSEVVRRVNRLDSSFLILWCRRSSESRVHPVRYFHCLSIRLNLGS